MRRSKSKYDRDDYEQLTHFAKRRAAEAIEFAKRLQEDPHKAKRHEAGQCPCCYYRQGGRIGGAAITTKPCDLCETEMTFGSTATDRICRDCSKLLGICRECGADIDLKTSRRKLKPQPQGIDPAAPGGEQGVSKLHPVNLSPEAKAAVQSPAKSITFGKMALLPPANDKCQACAADHPGNQIHNLGSVYYQVRFKGRHGREPTWFDCAAHLLIKPADFVPMVNEMHRNRGLPLISLDDFPKDHAIAELVDGRHVGWTTKDGEFIPKEGQW